VVLNTPHRTSWFWNGAEEQVERAAAGVRVPPLQAAREKEMVWLGAVPSPCPSQRSAKVNENFVVWLKRRTKKRRTYFEVTVAMFRCSPD